MPDPPPELKPASKPTKPRKPRQPKNPFMCKRKNKRTGKIQGCLYDALANPEDKRLCKARLWPFD